MSDDKKLEESIALDVPVEAGKAEEPGGHITEQLYNSLEDLDETNDILIFDDEDYEDEDYYGEDSEEFDDEYEDGDELEDGEELEGEDIEESSKKKRKIVPFIIAAAAVLVVAGVAVWFWLTSYDIVDGDIVIELGNAPSTEVTDYIKASDFVESKAKVDVSGIDNMTVGTYSAVVSVLGKQSKVEVEVVDTVNPEVVLKADIKGVAGKEVAGDAILKTVSDKAGIASIQFEQAQVEAAAEDAEEMEPSSVHIKYDTVGEQQNVVVVTDKSGNETRLPFQITIVEDYEAHVTGIQDMTVEQGTTDIDWLKDVTHDEKVLEVTVDDSAVDLNKVGEYELIYHIAGDDNETVVDKTVKVKVEEKAETQTTDTNSSTNNSSSSSGSSSSSSSGTGSSNSGSSNNSNSNNSSSNNSSSNNSSSNNSSSDNSSNNNNNNTDPVTPTPTPDPDPEPTPVDPVDPDGDGGGSGTETEG
ncbi:MAG: hypothetical protein ACRC3H_06350 [Lachnospiraceae bacterium]